MIENARKMKAYGFALEIIADQRTISSMESPFMLISLFWKMWRCIWATFSANRAGLYFLALRFTSYASTSPSIVSATISISKSS